MFRFFIGSDNSTGKIDAEYLKLIETLLASQVDGFTLYRATGSWQGTKEDSAIVEIAGIKQKEALKIAAKLKAELKQQAIGVQSLPEIAFV
jgi:hypothetical protein